MVRQYKQGSDAIVDELPGGSLKDAKEDPGALVRRELLEETGYVVNELVPLGTTWLDSRSSHTKCHLFLASECRYEKKPAYDEMEQIEVLKVPFGVFAKNVISGSSGMPTDYVMLVKSFPFLPWRAKMKIAGLFLKKALALN